MTLWGERQNFDPINARRHGQLRTFCQYAGAMGGYVSTRAPTGPVVPFRSWARVYQDVVLTVSVVSRIG
jgi:hypothetical protein